MYIFNSKTKSLYNTDHIINMTKQKCPSTIPKYGIYAEFINNDSCLIFSNEEETAVDEAFMDILTALDNDCQICYIAGKKPLPTVRHI